MQTSTFWLKFGSLSPTVTLKIRSRLLKPNQIFIMSQCYICANLIQICQPVHEISCRHFSQWFMQTSTFGLNLAVTFSLGQDHQNLISSSSYPISMQIWLKSAYWFSWDIMQTRNRHGDTDAEADADGIHTKTICPPPLRRGGGVGGWGDINISVSNFNSIRP